MWIVSHRVSISGDWPTASLIDSAHSPLSRHEPFSPGLGRGHFRKNMQVRLALVGSDCDPPTVTAIQSTTNLGMLLGPAVSGVAIAHVGVQNVLFLDAATFLVSTLCLIPIRMRHAVAPGPPQVAGTFLAEILTGFRFVVHQRTVRRPMLTSTFFSLGMSAFVFLLPIAQPREPRRPPLPAVDRRRGTGGRWVGDVRAPEPRHAGAGRIVDRRDRR